MSRRSSSIKRYLLFSTCIMMMTVLSSQTPLNEVSDFNFHQHNAYSIIEVGDRIYVAGQALVKDEQSSEREVFFAEYNSEFEAISHTVLHDDDDSGSGANNGRELLFLDGSLYRAFHEFGLVDDYSYIVRYDLEDKTINTIHQVRDTLNDLERVWSSALCLSDENNLVLSMINSTFQDYLTMWIQVIDPESREVVHQRVFEEPGLSMFCREILENSDGYILLGHSFDDNNDVTTFIWQLDHELNVLKKVNLEDRNYYHIYLDAVMDGEDIVFINNEHLGNLNNWRSVLIKMDSELNVIWETPVGTSYYSREYSYYTEIVNSHDEDGYILCGVNDEQDSLKTPKGQIAKISTDGDSIWHRTFLPLVDGNGDLFDLTKSSDGNYLAAGNVGGLGSAALLDSIFTKIWLIKFDEDGHIVNKDTTDSATLLYSSSLRIFPNPTTDLIYLEHDDITGLCYELYDKQGQLLLSKAATEPYHTYMLSLAAYPSGIYFLHVLNPNGRRHIEKLVRVE